MASKSPKMLPNGARRLSIALLWATVTFTPPSSAATPFTLLLRRLAGAQRVGQGRLFEQMERGLATELAASRLPAKVTREELERIGTYGTTWSREADLELLQHLRSKVGRDEAGAFAPELIEFTTPRHAGAYQQAMADFLRATSFPKGGVQRLESLKGIEELDNFDLTRISEVEAFAEATGRLDYIALIRYDYHGIAVIGRLDGRRVYGQLSPNAEISVDDLALKLLGAQPRRPVRPALFIDDSAANATRVTAGTRARWNVYKGKLDRPPIWDNVYVGDRTAQESLKKFGDVPIDGPRRLALNLVDDPGTRLAFDKAMSGHAVESLSAEQFSIERLRRTLARHRGSFVFALAHVESKSIYVGGKKLAVSTFEAEARAHQCVPIVLGCNAGACTSGPLGELNSIEAIDALRRAMGASNLKGVLEALATREHPLVVRGAMLDDVERTNAFVAFEARAPVPTEATANSKQVQVVVTMATEGPSARLASIVAYNYGGGSRRDDPAGGSAAGADGTGGMAGANGTARAAGAGGRGVDKPSVSQSGIGGEPGERSSGGNFWTIVFATIGVAGATTTLLVLRGRRHGSR